MTAFLLCAFQMRNKKDVRCLLFSCMESAYLVFRFQVICCTVNDIDVLEGDKASMTLPAG